MPRKSATPAATATPTAASSLPPRRQRLLATLLAASTLLTACSPDGGTGQAAPQRETGPVAQGAPYAASAKMASLDERAPSARRVPQSLGKEKTAVMAETPPVAASMSPAVTANASVAMAAAAGGSAATARTQRFLAVRHHLQIESPAADLASRWESVKSACERLDCYVEGSALQRETAQSAAAAYLTMRVNPRDFAVLTAALGGDAKVLNHQTSTEDKTSEVVDVEAQIKNRSEYRDSLRELLREKNVKRTLQDLMEIRDTMSQVQAEIDAANTQRALLERETAKQLVQMQFQPARVIVSGTYSPWQHTWQRSWDRLTHSVQSVILAIAELLPWLIVLALVVGLPLWLTVRSWRRRQCKQGARASAQPATPAMQTEAAQDAETQL